MHNNHTLVKAYLKDVANEVTAWQLPTKENGLNSGKRIGEIRLPGIGNIGTLRGRYNETDLYYSFESLNIPGDFYHVDIANDKSLSSKKISSTEIIGYN